jgi:hypothetical protein
LVHEVLDRDVQAVVRGGARCASLILDRGAQVVSLGAARWASQVLGRGAKTDACDAAQVLGSGAQTDRGSAPRRRSLCMAGLCSFIAVPRRLLAAALVVCRPRRYLIVVPRPMPAAARRNLIMVLMPFPAAALVVHRRYFVVAPGRCPQRRSLCAV